MGKQFSKTAVSFNLLLDFPIDFEMILCETKNSDSSFLIKKVNNDYLLIFAQVVPGVVYLDLEIEKKVLIDIVIFFFFKSLGPSKYLQSSSLRVKYS